MNVPEGDLNRTPSEIIPVECTASILGDVSEITTNYNDVLQEIKTYMIHSAFHHLDKSSIEESIFHQPFWYFERLRPGYKLD